MRGTILHAPGDIRVEERDDPKIVDPTDAVIKVVAACVCGSDLWPYRGLDDVDGPSLIGHEYVGIVEEVGSEVTEIKKGQIGGFYASDGDEPWRHSQAPFMTSGSARSEKVSAKAARSDAVTGGALTTS